MNTLALWFGLLACVEKGDAYILDGTVVEVHAPQEVVVAHEAVPALGMEAMTMPFAVRDPALLDGVQPGDVIVSRLIIDQEGSYLAQIRVTGHGPVPAAMDDLPGPIHPGEVLPRFSGVGEDGLGLAIGEGQGIRTAVAFIYTRCPVPEFCPLTARRLGELQAQVGTEARLVAVTMDPEFDTPEVLSVYGQSNGADPKTWRFLRLSEPDLEALAGRSALVVSKEDGSIVHGHRLLVLDADGRLIERYDDANWPLARVVEQLKTGSPSAPPGQDGTVTP